MSNLSYMKRVMMLVLPTDWSPKKTSLYFAKGDTDAIFFVYNIDLKSLSFFFPNENENEEKREREEENEMKRKWVFIQSVILHTSEEKPPTMTSDFELVHSPILPSLFIILHLRPWRNYFVIKLILMGLFN